MGDYERAREAAIEAVMKDRHLVSESSRSWAAQLVDVVLDAAIPHLQEQT